MAAVRAAAPTLLARLSCVLDRCFAHRSKHHVIAPTASDIVPDSATTPAGLQDAQSRYARKSAQAFAVHFLRSLIHPRGDGLEVGGLR